MSDLPSIHAAASVKPHHSKDALLEIERENRSPHPRTLYVLVLMACALGCAALVYKLHGPRGVQARPEESAVLVRTVPAEQGDMAVNLDALGTAVPAATVNLYSQVSGTVTAVHYHEGQMVRQGDALVDIDPRSYEAQLEQAEGALDRDRGYIRQAEIDLARYREAYAEHAVAKQVLDDQEQALRQYQGQSRNDEGQVAYARVQLGYCHLRAPIAGKIGLRLVDRGNTVFAGGSAPLAVITQMRPMTVVFNVPEDRLQEVRQAMPRAGTLPVEALDPEAKTVLAKGQLQALDNQMDSATGTLRLRATFANDDLSLYPNQFINARLRLRTLKKVTLVPSSAIQRNGADAYVYVLAGQLASMRQVTELSADALSTAVKGLSPGDQIVTTGFDLLQDGTRIKPEAAAGEREAASE